MRRRHVLVHAVGVVAIAPRHVLTQPRTAVVELVDATEAALQRRVVYGPDPRPLSAREVVGVRCGEMRPDAVRRGEMR